MIFPLFNNNMYLIIITIKRKKGTIILTEKVFHTPWRIVGNYYRLL